MVSRLFIPKAYAGHHPPPVGTVEQPDPSSQPAAAASGGFNYMFVLLGIAILFGVFFLVARFKK